MREFKMCLHALPLELTDEEIQQILYVADADGSGEIDYDEFISLLDRQPIEKQVRIPDRGIK